jgi:hypothetical protein
MWGNQSTGESIWQDLKTPFIPGKTYSISFTGKWTPTFNRPYPVQFSFHTTNAAYNSNTLIGVSDPLTSPGDWVTMTLPDWTATGSDTDPFSTIIVNATNHSSFFHSDSTSHGYITAICITEARTTGISDIQPNTKGFKLGQSYPNPSSQSVVIQYAVPHNERVIIKVYNMNGMEIKTLVNDMKIAGEHQVEWNAMGLPGGIYFYQMQAGRFTETKKMELK